MPFIRISGSRDVYRCTVKDSAFSIVRGLAPIVAPIGCLSHSLGTIDWAASKMELMKVEAAHRNFITSSTARMDQGSMAC